MIVLHRQGLSAIAPVGGSLSGVVASFTTSQTANLTSLGTTDWAAYGYNVNAASIERKSTGGSLISTLSPIGGVTLANFNFNPNTHYSLTWTDGTPDASISNEAYAVYAQATAVGKGISLTAPADLTSRTLTVYFDISASVSNAKMVATLSDGSAGPYTDTSVSGAGANVIGTYTFTYKAASAGQTLTIAWTTNISSSMNCGVFAATLQ